MSTLQNLRGGFCPPFHKLQGVLCPPCKKHEGCFVHLCQNEQGVFCPGGVLSYILQIMVRTNPDGGTDTGTHAQTNQGQRMTLTFDTPSTSLTHLVE